MQFVLRSVQITEQCERHAEFSNVKPGGKEPLSFQMLIQHANGTSKISKQIRFRPHRKRAAAAGSDLCPRREGVRTVLHKTALSPSDRRRADAADQSRSRRAADICLLQ
jgi:hypothetical protein